MIQQIQIELTNACTAKCLFCSHRYMTRPVVHMDLNLIEKIVNEIKEIELPSSHFLGVCGLGEPILHPKLYDVLQILKQIPFGIGTNGMFLTKDKIIDILDARPISIAFSLDAISAETHSKMRPGLNFETVMQNIRDFFNELRHRDKFWRHIFLQFIPTVVNSHEIEKFINFWDNETKGIEDVKIVIKQMYQWLELDNPYYPGYNFQPYNHDKVIWGNPSDNSLRKICNLFNSYIGILSNGTYVPCCVSQEDDSTKQRHFEIGNVKNNTMMELFNSSKMNKFRELFAAQKFDEIPCCSCCV